ncbi:hypothetical protein MHU86_10694 [Fragilaria crotonensis]|nr:hypothetical protein MHU86_10694 [Fragilaria crotonensis]
MELNPFNSTFFAWVDVGYMRDSLLVDQRMIRFLPATLTKEQTLILDTHAMDRASHVGGGFIGGYKEGLSRWIKHFYAIIEANYRDHFVGKDQPWMFETCQRTPALSLELSFIEHPSLRFSLGPSSCVGLVKAFMSGLDLKVTMQCPKSFLAAVTIASLDLQAVALSIRLKVVPDR